MTAALRHLARWLVWQIGEPEPPREHAEARITVISGGAKPASSGKSLSGSSSA